jgi:hypothetical protein
MKKVILVTLLLSTSLISCNSNKTEETAVSDEQQYACPMDPDVVGKKGEKCTKCGMELTELVDASHDGSAHKSDSLSH